MLAATLLSLSVVFLAELGDRSQLITMTYALRYRWWVVLPGVAIAAFLAHGVSVTIGHFLGATLPARPIGLRVRDRVPDFRRVGLARGRRADDEAVSTAAEPRFALLTVVSSFALAEMSDKTTLATVTLASDHDWAGVWIGSHRWAWSWPTAWRLAWERCCTAAFPSSCCTSWPACCS